MDFDACIKVHLNPSPGELSYVGGHGPERVVVGMWASHPQRCASWILTLLLNLVSSFPLKYVEIRLKHQSPTIGVLSTYEKAISRRTIVRRVRSDEIAQ